MSMTAEQAPRYIARRKATAQPEWGVFDTFYGVWIATRLTQAEAMEAAARIVTEVADHD